MADSGREKDALSFARQDSAKGLVSKFRELKKGRETLEKDWKLNVEFYRGNQYAYFNKRASEIQQLPTDDGDKPRFRIRLVSNQILPGSQTLLAQLTKTKPVISATPGTASNSSLRKATVAERLYEYWWQHLALADKLDEALLWGMCGGQGFWKISWDKFASTKMKFLIDPNTKQPILQDDLANAFRRELQQQGVDPAQAGLELSVALGDIRVEAMSPMKVYLDPTPSEFADCLYAVCIHAMTPEEIGQRWPKGKDLQPDAAPELGLMNTMGIGEKKDDVSLRNVYIGYFLPTAALPKGRYVVWTEGPDTILQDSPWPYSFQMLPLVKFPGVRVPGSVYDDAINTHARPLQKELNRTISQVVEYKNLTIKPRVWAPVGSLRQRMTNEPGAVYEFQPIGGLKPEIEHLPTMPPYVFEHLREIQQRLDRLYNLTAVGRGEVPPNVEAGVAIDLLQETAVDQMVPTIKRIESALARAGKIMMHLGHDYYIEPRLAKIVGSNGSVSVFEFKNSDIDPDVDFYAEAGSGIPRTRAGREARIKNMVDMQILEPRHAIKYLDVADLRGVAARFQAPIDQALREHDKILQGEPINPEAVQNLQQAVMGAIQAGQPPMNPETGQPFQSEQEVMQALKQASLTPRIGEDWNTHLEEHNQLMMSVDFENWPMDKRSDMIMHFNLTLQAQSQQQQAGEPPKVTYQIKGTAGPSTSAKILNKAGVDTTPEEEAEEPLSTWVTDSLDKPDADSSGNDPLTQQEIQMYESAQAMHSSVAAAETAAAGHEKSHASHITTLTALEKAREASAKADLAERKAAAPLPHQQKKPSG